MLRRLWKTRKLHDIDELLVEYHGFRCAINIAKAKRYTKLHRYKGIYLISNYYIVDSAFTLGVELCAVGFKLCTLLSPCRTSVYEANVQSCIVCAGKR